jgi:replicative DNA helicase
MSYLVRSNPVMASMIKRDWLSDILLQDIFTIVNDLRVVLTKAMLMRELESREMIGKDEEGLYEDVVDQLFEADVSAFNDKNTRHMMVQVLELSESRRILTGCGELIGKMRKFNLKDAKRKLAVLARPIALVDNENAGMYLDDYGERVEAIEQKLDEADQHDEFEVGIPTGVYRFDRQIGGIMPKEFGVIAGITGVGKTAALISFGLHAWEKGYDVMIVSGEMAKDLLGFRIDSYLTGIHGMKFRTAELNEEDLNKWDATIKMYRAKMDNFLYVATYPRRFTVENIEQDMVRLEEETGRKVRVVCMDYINIMDPVRRGEGNWQDQQAAVWDFKGFVTENNLVGWTAGQVKDEAYEKELYESSDLKYARAIGECAPVIAALIKTERDIAHDRMKLQIIKMRNAPLPLKPISLSPRLEVMRLHENMTKMKTLKGRASGVVDAKKKTKSVRPKKTLHGK